MLDCDRDFVSVCVDQIRSFLRTEEDMAVLRSFVGERQMPSALGNLARALEDPRLELPKLEKMYQQAVRNNHSDALEIVGTQLKLWCRQGPDTVEQVAGILGKPVPPHLSGMPLVLQFLEAHPEFYGSFSKKLFRFENNRLDTLSPPRRSRNWCDNDAGFCISFMTLGARKYAEGKLKLENFEPFFEETLRQWSYIQDGCLLARSLSGTCHLADMMRRLDAPAQTAICKIVFGSQSFDELMTASAVEPLTQAAKEMLQQRLEICPVVVLRNVLTEDVMQLLSRSMLFRLAPRAFDLEPTVRDALLKHAKAASLTDVSSF